MNIQISTITSDQSNNKRYRNNQASTVRLHISAISDMIENVMFEKQLLNLSLARRGKESAFLHDGSNIPHNSHIVDI
jgi:hypothetical protein